MSMSIEPRQRKEQSSTVLQFPQPSLQLIYDTAPIGLAFLSPDCRYLQINHRLTEICGISVEDHLGRFVRECVPALADAVEDIVQSIMETGEPVTGIEVNGQRVGENDERLPPDLRIEQIGAQQDHVVEHGRPPCRQGVDGLDALGRIRRPVRNGEDAVVEAEHGHAVARGHRGQKV